MEIARNKNGELVVGENLYREKKFKKIDCGEEEDYHGHFHTVYREDRSQPLESTRWISDNKIFFVEEKWFQNPLISALKWEDEPLSLDKRSNDVFIKE